MHLFMGIFFIIVSLLKLADLRGFAHAFSMYDLIARRSKGYAYAYPFIELLLGIAYVLRWQAVAISIVTLALMLIGFIGVLQNLLSPNRVRCACLGTLIKVPLTKFTLVEDAIMAVMAAWMIANSSPFFS